MLIPLALLGDKSGLSLSIEISQAPLFGWLPEISGHDFRDRLYFYLFVHFSFRSPIEILRVLHI
jgi:hypothetical protein